MPNEIRCCPTTRGDNGRVRDDDGRKLDHKTLETLRMRAVKRVQAGQHPEDVAVAMGFHKNTVYGWLAKVREGGKDALKAKPVPGRPPKLAAEHLSRLYELIVGNDPRQLSFGFALWTREMVRELIWREFTVKLSVVSVGRLLHTMGLSPQRPLHRAYEQDPEAVQRWKTEEFPAIRHDAKKSGATIYFADEAGVRSDYHSGTTWAPVGHTPVVANTGARWSINMLSAVSAQGKLRFMIHDGRVDSKVFVDFSDGRLKLFFLPGYSPQLNPDEWVWKNVKHDRIGKTGVTSKDDLKTKAGNALRRLQRLPHLVEGFFRDPNLAYITA